MSPSSVSWPLLQSFQEGEPERRFPCGRDECHGRSLKERVQDHAQRGRQAGDLHTIATAPDAALTAALRIPEDLHALPLARARPVLETPPRGTDPFPASCLQLRQ